MGFLRRRILHISALTYWEHISPCMTMERTLRSRLSLGRASGKSSPLLSTSVFMLSLPIFPSKNFLCYISIHHRIIFPTKTSHVLPLSIQGNVLVKIPSELHFLQLCFRIQNLEVVYDHRNF